MKLLLLGSCQKPAESPPRWDKRREAPPRATPRASRKWPTKASQTYTVYTASDNTVYWFTGTKHHVYDPRRKRASASGDHKHDAEFRTVPCMKPCGSSFCRRQSIYKTMCPSRFSTFIFSIIIYQSAFHITTRLHPFSPHLFLPPIIIERLVWPPHAVSDNKTTGRYIETPLRPLTSSQNAFQELNAENARLQTWKSIVFVRISPLNPLSCLWFYL